MIQLSDDSVSNSPATLEVPLSPVTNKERHTQDCEADAVHRQRQKTDQDVIIKSPRHFQDFNLALYDSQFE